MMKKLVAMLLILILCVGLAVTASAATDTGTTGACTWTFDEATGVLTISGNGAMANYSGSNDDQPWASYKDNIQTIVINEGVTSIGSYAFSKYPALKEVFIPGSVDAIGSNAFYSCASLSTVEYWGITEPTASSNAFSGTYSLLFVKVPDNYSDRLFGGVMARTSLESIDSNTTYNISISASPAEGGIVTGAGTYHAGKVAITAAANPGYRFVEWQESGTKNSTASTHILTANSNHTIVAVFEQETADPTYTVTIDSNIKNGRVTADKTTGLKEGDTVTLSVSPINGYVRDTVTVMHGETEVPVTGNQFTMPAGNVNVKATFKAARTFKMQLKLVDEAGQVINAYGQASVRNGIIDTNNISGRALAVGINQIPFDIALTGYVNPENASYT